MFKQIKQHIAWRKKRLIIELAMIVIIIAPTIWHIGVQFIPVSQASYAKTEQSTPLEEWVDKRKLEIFEEKREEYLLDSKMWALLEAQEMLQDELLGE